MEESKFDLVKYKNSYNSEKYDRITIMPPKGSREAYQRAAAKAGESVRMERDMASKDETNE